MSDCTPNNPLGLEPDEIERRRRFQDAHYPVDKPSINDAIRRGFERDMADAKPATVVTSLCSCPSCMERQSNLMAQRQRAYDANRAGIGGGLGMTGAAQSAENVIDPDLRIKIATVRLIEAQARGAEAEAATAEAARDQMLRLIGTSGEPTAADAADAEDVLARWRRHSGSPDAVYREALDNLHLAVLKGMQPQPITYAADVPPEVPRLFESVIGRIEGINDILWDHVMTLEALVQRVSPIPEPTDGEPQSEHVPNGAYATTHAKLHRTDELILRLGKAAAFLRTVA